MKFIRIVRIMSKASHRNTDKWEFKAKERDLSRCKNYMYRRKKSIKLDKVLNLLKNARFSRRLSTLVTLLFLSSVKQWSHYFNQLLSFLFVSLSFYLSVLSSFHWAFQAHFIRRFKSISSWHIKEHFKLILSDVSSLFLLDIWCYWSRLTIDSCLLHACNKACFVHVYCIQ